MPIKLASLKVDTKAEAEGEWIDLDTWIGLDPDRPFEVTNNLGLRFMVRSPNAPEYKLARQKAVEKTDEIRKANADGIIADDVGAQIDGELIGGKLLLDWSGFDEPYSKDLATEMLCDPASRTLREMVIFCANKVGKRKVERIEEMAKNSKRQSASL